MSLKAKIEAVIYASEEPVTLPQLIGLLGEEAQAELDALAATQQSLLLQNDPDPNSGPDQDALNEEVLDHSEATSEAPVILSEDGAAIESKDPDASSDAPAVPTLDPIPPDEKKLATEKSRRLRDYFRSLLNALIADCQGDRGIEIVEVAGGFRLRTKPEFHDAVRGFVKSLKPPLKLSLQALETLAVVAYKQPVTAPEISDIRGVDSAGVLGSLLARKLVTTAGRKQVIGRPILYKTTRDFLLRFGLKDIAELPSIEEFEKMAGELNETLLDQESEAQQDIPEETPMDTLPQYSEDSEDGFDSSLNGESAPVSERDAPIEPTHIHHDTAEDLMSDHSTHPEGVRREHADKTEVESA
jgi:segregation and condensation protein B